MWLRSPSASIVPTVILHDLTVDEHEFAARTGWAIKPAGRVQGRGVRAAAAARRRRGDGRLDVVRRGRAARHAARRGRGARHVGARARDRGHRPGADVRRSRRSSRSPTSTATRSSCRACAARRCCSSRGRRGEAAASTCPCGRHCAPSCHPLGLEIVTVALDVDGERGTPVRSRRPHPNTRR